MGKSTPTIPPPRPDDLSSALRRNIQALEDRRRQEAAAAPMEVERILPGSAAYRYLT